MYNVRLNLVLNILKVCQTSNINHVHRNLCETIKIRKEIQFNRDNTTVKGKSVEL